MNSTKSVTNLDQKSLKLGFKFVSSVFACLAILNRNGTTKKRRYLRLPGLSPVNCRTPGSVSFRFYYLCSLLFKAAAEAEAEAEARWKQRHENRPKTENRKPNFHRNIEKVFLPKKSGGKRFFKRLNLFLI